jgi:hypothetical protein
MMLETGSELRDDGLAWYDTSAMGIDIACAAPTTCASNRVLNPQPLNPLRCADVRGPLARTNGRVVYRAARGTARHAVALDPYSNARAAPTGALRRRPTNLGRVHGGMEGRESRLARGRQGGEVGHRALELLTPVLARAQAALILMARLLHPDSKRGIG